MHSRHIKDLLLAWHGYRKDRQEQWQMHRLSGYLSFIGMNGTKQFNRPDKLWQFVWDQVEKLKPVSKMRLLTREEAIDHYAQRGVQLSEAQLSRMKFKKDK